MTKSPYDSLSEALWPQKTRMLVDDFPLDTETLCRAVLEAWDDIYSSSIGHKKLKIGLDIFLPAQAIGVIIEKLIALRLNDVDNNWRGGNKKAEKDIVYGADDKFSFEIKTSSSKSGLYGNRSTGHRSKNKTKSRTGYYLVVNYKLPREDDLCAYIQNIRFGWIDDKDWIGQAKPTGQQASIGAKLAALKLMTLYSNN